jgi:protein-S-isoprenylcysteine O-methyltransferase Ste14
VIYLPWIVFAVVWIIGARFGKRTTRMENSSERAFHIMGSVLAAWLVFHSDIPANSNIQKGIGFVLSVAGVALAIWARVLLGTNWSGMVTLKEDHELIRRGPYVYVRHPIYSGMLLALLGTAIWFGRWEGFVGFGIAFVTFLIKSRTEERFMVDHFGDQYRRYRSEVRALIPGLL